MSSEVLRIAATERSPEIELDVERGLLRLRGESYPEDASSVFAPVFVALQAALANPAPTGLEAEFALIYFNSSSAKALMNMFLLLERAAASGIPVRVRWLYAAEDETMREFGEDFSEDLSHVAFDLVAVGAED
ncbi:DUF1987 domain-containing protein [Phaeospirillum tilakii]|uniref:DUF1987 domain-containing protein n=1 Tax=Phaeospirillum tilakii TaxID=741673 RepID=A0ABW5C8G3_9PROT